jgi:predicted anti-sigma-YlaC factor YlaD
VPVPPQDPDTELIHPDAAGWVLGVLEPEDADRFAEHLPSCADCRAVVAEFSPAARMLATAAHAEPPLSVMPDTVLPPADLQARTLAAVAQAAAATRWTGLRVRRADLRVRRADLRVRRADLRLRRADLRLRRADLRVRRADRLSRWREWPVRVVSLVAAIVLAAAVSAGFLLSGSSPAQAYTTTLHPVAAAAAVAAASGQTVQTQTSNGWSVQLTAAHLPELKSGQVYECWWSGPGNELSSAGTFTVGSSGTASVRMSTAANPDDFPTVQIAVENAGQANQLGRVVLTGTISDDD